MHWGTLLSPYLDDLIYERVIHKMKLIFEPCVERDLSLSNGQVQWYIDPHEQRALMMIMLPVGM